MDATPRPDAARLLGPVAALAVLAVHALGVPLDGRAGVALALAGIVVGVPHGAADHLVPFWASGRRVTRQGLAVVLAGYVAVVGLALGCVLVAPVPTVWAFLVVSAVHFGRGEVVAVAEQEGRPVPPATRDVLPAAAHGAVAVGLPLAAWRDTSLPILDTVAPGFAATPGAVLDAVLVAVWLLVAAAVVRLLVARRRGEAAELVVLAALFALVPAPAAFGVYFAAWHAARHTARLVRLPGPDGTVDVRAGVRRYVRAAALPTVAALALLGVVVATRSPAVLAAAVVTLVGLTAPHLAVVAVLDRSAARRRAPAAAEPAAV